jgi:hypothetical protein
MSFPTDMRPLFAVLLFALCGLAVAQSTEEPRGSIPPGTAADGSRPADGAIKGGSIQPGETGGLPDERVRRCKELSGTLREDCLKKEQDANTGAGAPDKGGARTVPEPDAPPPQNPR